MMNFVILIVVMVSVVMLSVIMLSAIMLSGDDMSAMAGVDEKPI
jgi:hypothetical protein